jgi:hypothetical protein
MLLGRERDRAPELGVRTGHRLHDLLRRLIDDLVIIGLEPNADLLSCCHGSLGPT